jgi:hypothetical protein
MANLGQATFMSSEQSAATLNSFTHARLNAQHVVVDGEQLLGVDQSG